MDREKGKRKIAESLELPKEVLLGLPKITITANEEIIIENHRGVIYFGSEEVKVQTKLGDISVQGKDLEVLFLSGNTMIIGGKFAGVRYEKV